MRKTLEDFLKIYQDPQYTDDYIKEMLKGWASVDFCGFPCDPDTFHATYDLGYIDDKQYCKIFFPNQPPALKSVDDIFNYYNDFSFVIIFSWKVGELN